MFPKLNKVSLRIYVLASVILLNLTKGSLHVYDGDYGRALLPFVLAFFCFIALVAIEYHEGMVKTYQDLLKQELEYNSLLRKDITEKTFAIENLQVEVQETNRDLQVKKELLGIYQSSKKVVKKRKVEDNGRV